MRPRDGQGESVESAIEALNPSTRVKRELAELLDQSTILNLKRQEAIEQELETVKNKSARDLIEEHKALSVAIRTQQSVKLLIVGAGERRESIEEFLRRLDSEAAD